MLKIIFSSAFIVTFLAAAVRLAVPLAFAAIGENISEKAGIINVGLEALMLSGAFFGFATTFLTGSMILGFLVAMVGGVLFSLLHAFLSIHLQQDQTVAGVTLNLFAVGVTSYLYLILVNSSDNIPQVVTLKNISIPLLSKIPIIGPTFFERDIVTYIIYFLIILVSIFLRKTTWGLSLCSVGENPKAADTVGLPVRRIQYFAAISNGVFGGLGGAYLVLGQLGVFYENITAGRGFIALAIVVFGRRNTLGIFLASIFFGAADAFQFRLQSLGINLPTQLFSGMPYIFTVLALLIVSKLSKKSSNPKALGIPYNRVKR